ncbi:hypothetical protein JXQ70_19525 [bacterium]|nr:hypothetical protein [bacterium]
MTSENVMNDENRKLRAEFARRKLDPGMLLRVPFEDIAQENELLKELLEWVEHYETCRNRTLMEVDGFLYPPVFPDNDPDSDWFRFELWMQGRPTSFVLRERLPDSIVKLDLDTVSDEELSEKLAFFIEILSYHDIEVDFYDRVPDRLVFEQLLRELDEEFDLMAGGTCHLDGCTGFCPECFQRPWCEQGTSSCWDEDHELGRMFLVEPVQRYVSATPFSLEILEQFHDQDDDLPF